MTKLRNELTHVPILLCVYRRAEKFRLVVESLRVIKPKQIYISANAPKNRDEEHYTNLIKNIIDSIDWDCEVHKKYELEHIGDCSESITRGIDWFFDCVDYGIILEDDCIISSSFYNLCCQLLPAYKDDSSIFHISGTNLCYNHDEPIRFFNSNFSLPSWGWATWKRAWEKYTPTMDNWVSIEHIIRAKVYNYDFWKEILIHNSREKIAWDLQWNIDIWKNNAKIIMPSYNLVSNIGFDSLATLTKNKNNIAANLPMKEFVIPEKIDFYDVDNLTIEKRLIDFILKIGN